MTITVRKAGNAAIVDLNGSLNMGDPVQNLRARVQELLDGGNLNLAINLAGVPDMDSSGIGALVAIYKAAQGKKAKCKFFAPNVRVMQVIKMVRLDSVLDLAENETSALAGF